jgi:hypothetical protein
VSCALLGVGDVRKFGTTALQKINPFRSKQGKLQTYTSFFFCSYERIIIFAVEV